MSRIEVAPGAQSTPAHEHTAEEELFYVLGGAGLWWQEGATAAIGAGDVCFAKPGAGAHTIIAGDEGIDVLAFGPRRPVALEARAGRVERGRPRPRPANVVTLLDLPTKTQDRPGWEMVHRHVGHHLGAVTTGMSHFELRPGARSFPFHCHSAEEELFVVLDGDGTLRLGDARHSLRRGSIVSRPAGTRIAHQFIAGDGGLAVLAHSDIEPNDIAFYPDSSKVKLRGLNVVFRVEPVDYWDGEA
jgi:uncharacterized cupin superfamily protein